jgi:hypothetical protein
MRGGALIQPIAMEVGTPVKVTNVINRVNFCGCRLRGFICVKVEHRLLPQVADKALTTLSWTTALTCDRFLSVQKT